MIMISPSRTEWLACQENKTVPWPWRICCSMPQHAPRTPSGSRVNFYMAHEQRAGKMLFI